MAQDLHAHRHVEGLPSTLDGPLAPDLPDGRIAVDTSASLDPALDALCRTALRAFDASLVLVLAPGEGRWRIRGAAGPVRKYLNSERIVIDEILARDTTVVIADVVAHLHAVGRNATPALTEMRFQAGVPILARDGERLGLLLLFDLSPRSVSSTQDELLGDLARLASDRLGALASRAVPGRADVDIDILRASERALSCLNQRLESALEASRSGLWDLDLATSELWVSKAWYERLGHAPPPRSFAEWFELVHPEDRNIVERSFTDHLRGLTDAYEAEFRFRRADGDYLWTGARGRTVRGGDGVPRRVIGVAFDLSEVEVRSRHLAFYDPLTRLPNRAALDERLETALSEASSRGHRVAALYLDLDRFKAVNDTLGHAAGDALLKEVASRLRSAVRDGDLAARLGGDEFVVVQPGIRDLSDVERIAERIAEVMREPVDFDGRRIEIAASIGIALYPEDATTAGDLLIKADVALYRAKSIGRDRVVFYAAEMDAGQVDRRLLEYDLRSALSRDELRVVYQPIFGLEDRRVAQFEALLQWHHPERGYVAPQDFIAIAEESGLIGEIGAFVLDRACRDASLWPDHVGVCVNVSPAQLRDPGFAAMVVETLARHGLPANRLECEVTESALAGTGDRALETLTTLRARGVRIALDDFGVGYSCLSYFARFTFDRIKIDRSFVAEIEKSANSAIVQAVVALAATFGSGVTAEGVETREQLLAVEQAGCRAVQGYLFARPCTAEDVGELIALEHDIAWGAQTDLTYFVE